MYGYVKPYVPTLTVAQHEAYKAVYCGLCREIGRTTGQASRLFLSYDLTYLAVFRMAIEGMCVSFSRRPCIAHPSSRRLFAEKNDALTFSAYASALLAAGKIADERKDERGFRRACAAMLSPFEKKLTIESGKKLDSLPDSVFLHLEELHRKEDEKTPSIDEPAECFAALLGDVASFGLSGNDRMIACAVGRSLGKIVYVLDAADDAYDDKKSEKYNPVTLVYGRDIFTNDKKPRVRKEIADEIYTAVCLESERLCHTLDLADFSSSATLSGIIYNVADAGIKASARHVLYNTGENDDPFRHKY